MWGAIIPAVAGGLMSAMGSDDRQTTSAPEPWSEAKPFARDIMGQGQSLYQQGGMNPLMNLGLQNQLGYWEMMAPGMINAAQGAWGQLLDPFSQGPMSQAFQAAGNMAQGGQNPYAQELMNSVAGIMGDDFRQGTLPQIAGNASTAGGYGGSRQAINESLATGKHQQALGTTMAQLASGFYGQDLQQQQAGVNAMGNLINTGFGTMQNAVAGAPGAVGLGAMPGAQQYGIGQTYWQAPWNALQNYNAAVSPYGSSGTVQTEPGIMQGLGGQIAGMGIQGLKDVDWGALFS